jgi:recombinational DNA repair protein (RecF pathway)
MYITEALVCGSRPQNTSDRAHLLFTREAGMVWATAKSVREERSKHRYGMQDFSLARVSLVRGKGGWRVTGTEPIANLYFEASTREARALVRDTVRLLRRFLRGETPAPALFDEIAAALRAAGADPAPLATALTLRTLHALGYIGDASSYRALLEAPGTLEAAGGLTDENRQAVEDAIAQAYEASHL